MVTALNLAKYVSLDICTDIYGYVLCPFCFVVRVFVTVFVDGAGEVFGTRDET